VESLRHDGGRDDVDPLFRHEVDGGIHHSKHPGASSAGLRVVRGAVDG